MISNIYIKKRINTFTFSKTTFFNKLLDLCSIIVLSNLDDCFWNLRSFTDMKDFEAILTKLNCIVSVKTYAISTVNYESTSSSSALLSWDKQNHSPDSSNAWRLVEGSTCPVLTQALWYASSLGHWSHSSASCWHITPTSLVVILNYPLSLK